MRIPALPPLMQQSLLATLGRAEAFTVASADADGRAAAILPPPVPSTTQPATSVQMLVALAAAEPTVERRRKMAAAADRGLTLLERFHAELMVGTPAPERLAELVEWSESVELPTDPHLASLQRDIEVRMRVELAKHDLRV